MKLRFASQQGMSLIEVMISFSVLIIGMFTLFKVAGVASTSNLQGRNFITATAKAQALMEALKEVPTQTLACLAAGTTPSGCYSSCVSGGSDANHCSLALGLDTTFNTDSHGVNFTPSFGVTSGPYPYTYNIEVVVSWKDQRGNPPKTHNIYFKTMVYRP